MNAGSGRLAYRRLRAPRDDRGVLIDPPWREVTRLIAGNESLRDARQYDMQGRSLTALSIEAREQLLARARHYTQQYRSTAAPSHATRLLLAGHQPELFHPGVWFKNFALGALAREHSAVAINLVIDSDTIKDVSLRVPGGSTDAPIVESVPFDESSNEIPFEEREIEDRRAFVSFGHRATDVLRPIVDDPLLAEFWPLVLSRTNDTANLGQCFSQARHVLEGAWGLDTLELPQSQVCALAAFHWFTAHLLAHLPRFREVYNESVEMYRRVHRIRSANHPAPNLAAQDDWLEAPFWLWCPGSPRRRRMFVRRHGSGLAITDRRKIEFELPLDADGDASRAVDVLASLAERGIKLRSRALVTTLFARLMLSDLFVHGIGGAKYDQLTDLLFERFFSLQPPAYLVLSSTLHLPVVHPLNPSAESRRIDDELRDLNYHPERYLDGLHGWPQAPVDVEQWLSLKSRWVGTEQTRENARERCHALRAANEALQAWVEPRRRELERERQKISRQARAYAVLTSREYAFPLYPQATLRDFLLAFPRTTS